MPTVQKLDRGMLETYIKNQGWNYSKDNDGDFIVPSLSWDSSSCELTCSFFCQDLDGGSFVEGHQFAIVGVPEKDIARSDWGKALLACNIYMAQFAWLKACLKVGDYDSDTSTRINLTQWITLETGAYQKLVDDFSSRTVGSMMHFCDWAHQERGLW